MNKKLLVTVTILGGLLMVSSAAASGNVSFKDGVKIIEPQHNTNHFIEGEVNVTILKAYDDTTDFDNVNFTVMPESSSFSTNTSLSKINETVANNEVFANFSATPNSTNNVVFEFNATDPERLYSLDINGTFDKNIRSDTQGNFQFNYSQWSTRQFTITGSAGFNESVNQSTGSQSDADQQSGFTDDGSSTIDVQSIEDAVASIFKDVSDTTTIGDQAQSNTTFNEAQDETIVVGSNTTQQVGFADTITGAISTESTANPIFSAVSSVTEAAQVEQTGEETLLFTEEGTLEVVQGQNTATKLVFTDTGTTTGSITQQSAEQLAFVEANISQSVNSTVQTSFTSAFNEAVQQATDFESNSNAQQFIIEAASQQLGISDNADADTIFNESANQDISIAQQVATRLSFTDTGNAEVSIDELAFDEELFIFIKQGLESDSQADGDVSLGINTSEDTGVDDQGIGSQLFNMVGTQLTTSSSTVETTTGFLGNAQQVIGLSADAEERAFLNAQADQSQRLASTTDALFNAIEAPSQNTSTTTQTGVDVGFLETPNQQTSITGVIASEILFDETATDQINIDSEGGIFSDLEGLAASQLGVDAQTDITQNITEDASDRITVEDQVVDEVLFNGEATQNTSTDDEADFLFNLRDVATQGIGISDTFNADVSFGQQVSSTTGITSLAQNFVGFTLSADQLLGIETNVTSNIAPDIENKTLIVEELGTDNDVKVKVNASDEESDLASIKVKNTVVQVSGASAVETLDIEDNLNDNIEVTVTDAGGLQSTSIIDYTVTDSTYEQDGTGYNLSEQKWVKEDQVTIDSDSTTYYDITHSTFGGTVTQGPNFEAQLDNASTDTITTKSTGDFLDETEQWNTIDSVYNDVENQSIGKTLNITSDVPGLEWQNINTTGTPEVSFFGDCNNCDAAQITFTDTYSNPTQYTDTGDGIEETFIQDISAQVVGERSEWWEEYRYVDVANEVKFRQIWANVSLDQGETDKTGAFIRFQQNGKFNKTVVPKASESCNTENPSTGSFTVGNQTFKACTTDVDNNGQQEYIKVQIPEFSTYNIRYGLSDRPAELADLGAGDFCTDRQEGDEFKNGTLICFKNEVIDNGDQNLPTLDVSEDVGEGVAGLILAIGFLAILVLLFGDEALATIGRTRDSIEDFAEGVGDTGQNLFTSTDEDDIR